MRTTMMMCVKADNFMKEAKLNWNLSGTGSTLQFKSLTVATKKQLHQSVEWYNMYFSSLILMVNLRKGILICHPNGIFQKHISIFSNSKCIRSYHSNFNEWKWEWNWVSIFSHSKSWIWDGLGYVISRSHPCPTQIQ